MTKKLLSYKLAILIIISLGLILGSQINTATATGCSDKYPGGECKAACDTTATGADKEYEDTDAALCTGSKCCHKLAAYPNIELQIPLPGIPGGSGPFTKAKSIVEYIVHLFALSLYIIIPLVIFMIILGGFKWILAAGNPSKIGEAKKLIYNSLLGLTISVLSYTLLSVVGLTTLEVPTVSYLGDEPTHGFAYWDPTVPGGWSDVPPEFSPPPGGGRDPNAPPGSGGSSLPGYPSGKGSGNCDSDTWEKLGCPGSSTEIQVCFTNYYSPDDPNDGGLYKKENPPTNNFLCNVGMNCGCPDKDKDGNEDRQSGYSCKDKYNTKPCKPFTPYQPGFKPHEDYCIGARPPVVADSSVAIDTTYFNYFCKFEIVGRTGTYEARDTGGGIKGLHMDFYCGLGKDSCKNIKAPKGPATIKILDLTSCYTSACRTNPWIPNNAPPPPPSAGTYTHDQAMTLLTAKNIEVTVSSGGEKSATCDSCKGTPAPLARGVNCVSACKVVNNTTCYPECKCTSLTQIPKVVIDSIIRIKDDMTAAGKTCDFRVTGGTEPCHHSHGPNLSAIDLSHDGCLVPYIKQKTKYSIKSIGTYTASPYYRELGAFQDGTATNAHFHLKF